MDTDSNPSSILAMIYYNALTILSSNLSYVSKQKPKLSPPSLTKGVSIRWGYEEGDISSIDPIGKESNTIYTDKTRESKFDYKHCSTSRHRFLCYEGDSKAYSIDSTVFLRVVSPIALSLIHISEPTRPPVASRMPSSA